MRPGVSAVGLLLLVTGACSGTERTTPATDPGVTSEGIVIAARPPVPEGPISDGLRRDLETAFTEIESGELGDASIVALGDHDDVRVGWILADLFWVEGLHGPEVVEAFLTLTGIDLSELEDSSPWKALNDHMIAWDVPAFEGYVDYKRRILTRIEPAWAPFFDDESGLLDWRLVGWGGVFIDDRPAGSTLPTCERGCIPALDDPRVTTVAEGDWYPDDAVVFGVVVGDEARAYPKNLMEVHEMVNDTLGGRRIGIPYCTLCGSAQLYFTDSVPDGVDVPVLRTSGLLSRSNKVMYDLVTASVFDTFTGVALTGPLREAGVVLDQGTVVASTWSAWRDAHPETTILASDAGLPGRVYPLDPLQGRDDDGPIFPVGPVDPRLGVHDLVLGVLTADGVPLAFPVDRARARLDAGDQVERSGVTVVLDGDGLRAVDGDGVEVVAHQSFWFAWSQFHPDTELWEDPLPPS